MKTLFAALLLALSLPAAGQVYVFGMGGHSKAATSTTPATSGSEFKTWHAGAGWRFSKYLAAEVGYLDIGNHGDADASWKADGFGIAAVGTLPISGPWALVGKAGLYRLESDFVAPGSTLVTSKLGSRPLLAIGGQYHVGDALHLQLLVQHIDGKNDTNLDNVRLISIGAVLQF
jgi:OOP family OmpA-OmpF porin